MTRVQPLVYKDYAENAEGLPEEQEKAPLISTTEPGGDSWISLEAPPSGTLDDLQWIDGDIQKGLDAARHLCGAAGSHYLVTVTSETYDALAKPVYLSRWRLHDAVPAAYAEEAQVRRHWVDEGEELKCEARAGVPAARAVLVGWDLRGAALRGADLRGALLANARLEGADLRGARLQGACLNGVRCDAATNMHGVRLDHASLQGADLRGVNLEAATLLHTDLAKATLQGAKFLHAKIDGAYFGRAHFEGACFDECDMRNVSLSGGHYRGASFVRAQLTDCKDADYGDWNHAPEVRSPFDSEDEGGRSQEGQKNVPPTATTSDNQSKNISDEYSQIDELFSTSMWRLSSIRQMQRLLAVPRADLDDHSASLGCLRDLLGEIFHAEQTDANWQECLQLWHLLYQQRSELTHKRGLAILDSLLPSDVRHALGMADQLKNTRGAYRTAPSSVLRTLKKMGTEVRLGYYKRRREIDAELSHILSILDYRSKIEQRVLAFAVTVGVAVANVVSDVVYKFMFPDD